MLLRARSAAAAVALLGEHLGGEERRIPAPELFERIEQDLVVLRENDFDMPRPAQAYCAEWVADGILVRRSVDGSRDETYDRDETYELSQGALVAIRFVAQLLEPRASVTQSRLATILERVHSLTIATDPDASTRLSALRARRDDIDARIAAVEAGRFDVLERGQALEQARDILALADERVCCTCSGSCPASGIETDDRRCADIDVRRGSIASGVGRKSEIASAPVGARHARRR